MTFPANTQVPVVAFLVELNGVKKKPFFFLRMLFPMGFDKLVDSSSDKICKIASYFFFTVLIRTNAKKGYIYFY